MLDTYSNWRERATTAICSKNTINHCVWGNKMIPPIGEKLWNEYLIHNDINYISDFMAEDDSSLLNHTDFIRLHNLDSFYLPVSAYNNITSAIGSFNWPNKKNRDIDYMNKDLTLHFFNPPTSPNTEKVKGNFIRSKMRKPHSPQDLTPIKTWMETLSYIAIDWDHVFYNLYTISNNFKLIQSQYKLLMRIATCKYKRYKMKLATEDTCSLCADHIETLDHIYLNCKFSRHFVSLLTIFIRNNIDPLYKDDNHVYFITCYHNNMLINYCNLVGKWFLGRSVQMGDSPVWGKFVRTVRRMLCGEKKMIKEKMLEFLS